MKSLYTFLLIVFSFCGNIAFAQLVLPEFNPIQKETVFNSTEEESSPIFFNSGNSVYFNRTYTEGDGETTNVTGQDIFFSTKGKDGWEKPYRLLREDDLPGENLIAGTNEDGTRIYVFNSFPAKDSLIRKLVYLDKAEKKYKWSDPVEVNIEGFEFGNSYVHFYVNSNESAILISRLPVGRKNDEDLFVSLKNKLGEWGPAIDLGKTVNTGRFELGSFITNDLKTIYFSSEGHGGYGASDIFVSRRLDDSWQNWTKPLNLGEPINSIDFDAFFVMANATDIYFTSDRQDQHSNIYKGTITGEVMLANTDSVKGVFIHQGKTVEGVTFAITDSKGNRVTEVTTDKDGGFTFEKLKGEENYLVKLTEEDSDFIGSKIYFLDGKNQKTSRYVYTKEGLFVNSNDLASSETIRGVFSYNSLPAVKTGLIVLDENGFPLDTIFTDDKGNFSYSVLDLDKGFSIIPLNMTDDEFVNVDMYLIDKDGNRLKTLRPKQFHLLSREDDKLVGNHIPVVAIDREDNSKGDTELGSWNGMPFESRTIYFEFDERSASNDELSKLTLVKSIIKFFPDRKIILTGYTDNVGDESVNKQVGLVRATAVKLDLISTGILSSDNIEIRSGGESNPVAENTTSAGRAKNRRVEITIK